MLGTLGGVTLTVFLPEPESSAILEEIYSGLWGLNTILSMASLSCVFFACNRASISLAIVNVAFTVLSQYGLRCVMTVQVSYMYYLTSSKSLCQPQVKFLPHSKSVPQFMIRVFPQINTKIKNKCDLREL